MIREPKALAARVPKGKELSRAKARSIPYRLMLLRAPRHATGLHLTVLIGEWFCLTRRSERRADDDSDGTGANPVGGIIGVAPKSICRGKAPVVDP